MTITMDICHNCKATGLINDTTPSTPQTKHPCPECGGKGTTTTRQDTTP